ncbi:MAG: hypothetical protein ABSF71_27930, partial [Terriglobia bacterium]
SLRRPPNFFQSPNPPNYKPLPSIVLQGLLPALLPYRRIGDPPTDHASRLWWRNQALRLFHCFAIRERVFDAKTHSDQSGVAV